MRSSNGTSYYETWVEYHLKFFYTRDEIHNYQLMWADKMPAFCTHQLLIPQTYWIRTMRVQYPALRGCLPVDSSKAACLLFWKEALLQNSGKTTEIAAMCWCNFLMISVQLALRPKCFYYSLWNKDSTREWFWVFFFFIIITVSYDDIIGMKLKVGSTHTYHYSSPRSVDDADDCPIMQCTKENYSQLQNILIDCRYKYNLTNTFKINHNYYIFITNILLTLSEV